jgi:hypothetical protein
MKRILLFLFLVMITRMMFVLSGEAFFENIPKNSIIPISPPEQTFSLDALRALFENANNLKNNKNDNLGQWANNNPFWGLPASGVNPYSFFQNNYLGGSPKLFDVRASLPSMSFQNTLLDAALRSTTRSLNRALDFNRVNFNSPLAAVSDSAIRLPSLTEHGLNIARDSLSLVSQPRADILSGSNTVVSIPSLIDDTFDSGENHGSLETLSGRGSQSEDETAEEDEAGISQDKIAVESLEESYASAIYSEYNPNRRAQKQDRLVVSPSGLPIERPSDMADNLSRVLRTSAEIKEVHREPLRIVDVGRGTEDIIEATDTEPMRVNPDLEILENKIDSSRSSSTPQIKGLVQVDTASSGVTQEPFQPREAVSGEIANTEVAEDILGSKPDYNGDDTDLSGNLVDISRVLEKIETAHENFIKATVKESAALGSSMDIDIKLIYEENLKEMEVQMNSALKDTDTSFSSELKGNYRFNFLMLPALRQ